MFANWTGDSGPVAVASTPQTVSTPSAAELADAALAAELLEASEEEAEFVGEEAAIDLALAATGEIVELRAASSILEVEVLTEETGETKTSIEPWLSEELLERVFG